MISSAVKELVNYGEKCGFLAPADRVFTVNRIIDAIGEDSYEEPGEVPERELHEILGELTDFAVGKGLCDGGIVTRDLFDTRLMGLLMPRPSEVISEFERRYSSSPESATEWYYKFSCDSNYIRRDRIKKDKKWVFPSEYGDIDITINLSKPEKDPRAIAAAKLMKQSGYPKCALCRENEGYAGTLTAAARENHRIIPVRINDSDWFFQYSPYVYYNEHCIVFNSKHTPMAINPATFRKLLDFVMRFPHYFVGSNADLPIVGGSILTHDHFQGGHYTFAMAKAPIEQKFEMEGFEDVEAGIVKWPMSVLRTRSKNPDRLIDLGEKVLRAWRSYTDEDAFIYAETDGEPHNTITPIARKNGDFYELDLVLRNNITTDEYPLGVYHPHAKLHHIKKENIGLIEVMGLAVLPARLAKEINMLETAMLNGENLNAYPELTQHAQWAEDILKRHPDFNKDNAKSIIEDEIGKAFLEVLEDAGVFKRNENGQKAFKKFITSINE